MGQEPFAEIFSLIQLVVTLFGLSRGKPNARDQIDETNTPIALETPNNTV